MATHRWLTLAAAILITALEAWSFTAASAVTTAASATNLSHGRHELRVSGNDGARLKRHP